MEPKKPKKSGPKAGFPNMNSCSPEKPTKEVSRELLLDIYKRLTGETRTNINQDMASKLEEAVRSEFLGLKLGCDWATGPTGTRTSLKITNEAVKQLMVERKKV